MRRKRVAKGPIRGPIKEKTEDRGPGRGELRGNNGKVPKRYTANGGFKPDNESGP